MKNLVTENFYYWERPKFLNRRFLMQVHVVHSHNS